MKSIFVFVCVLTLYQCSSLNKPNESTGRWPTYVFKKLEPDLSVSEVAIQSKNCQQSIDSSCRTIRSNVDTLAKLNKIIFIGDTGCRLKESAAGTAEYQSCENLQEWPFLLVSSEVAKEKADLVVHLGDYHYREQCSANNALCEKLKSTVGYHWRAWEEDFFRPVALSSMNAPWLFVRGNHEDCQRAHKGFLSFMTGKDYKAEANDVCPVSLPLEFYEFKDVTLINWDNSSLDDRKTWSDDVTQKVFNDLIEIKAKVYSKPEKTFILLSHKPLFAFVPLQNEYVVSNQFLIPLWTKVAMPSNLKFVMSGHIHNFQITKSASLPTQVVSGLGGTTLDPFSVDTTVEKLKSLPIAKELGFDFFTLTTNKQHFGYVVMEKQKNGEWKVTAKNIFDKNKVECTSGITKINCHKLEK